MTRMELLLVQLMEECAEVAQRASKALRFGLNEVEPNQKGPIPLTNENRLAYEIADLRVTVNKIADEGGLRTTIMPSQLVAKREKIEKYLNYSKELGILKE